MEVLDLIITAWFSFSFYFHKQQKKINKNKNIIYFGNILHIGKTSAWIYVEWSEESVECLLIYNTILHYKTNTISGIH